MIFDNPEKRLFETIAEKNAAYENFLLFSQCFLSSEKTKCLE